MHSSQEITPYRISGEHSYHRRSFHHDYHKPFIYHIILKKRRGFEPFGTVMGDAKIPYGNPGCAAIQESLPGRIISKMVLRLPHDYPILKLHQFCVMPDHVHLLLQVLLHSNYHLDFYIDWLKQRIATGYSAEKGLQISADEIFDDGYCDKPLYDEQSLDNWYRYIRENPHRLAMRLQYPQFFRRARNLRIDDVEYQAYGNLFLLRNPDKVAVKISSKYSEDEKQRMKRLWLDCAAKGSVVVSPFISAAEKAIRAEAETLGGGIILITHEIFPERFKPAKHDFDLCAAGRLLIISFGLPQGSPLTRKTCLAMNTLAAKIVGI